LQRRLGGGGKRGAVRRVDRGGLHAETTILGISEQAGTEDALVQSCAAARNC